VPCVSVFSVHNGETFLRLALDGLPVQSFEVFAADDGPTDSLGVILDRWAAEDPRVQVVHRSNASLIASLNRAVRLASGELVARMDADDLCEPDRFAVQVRHMDKRPDVGILGGVAAYMDEGGTLTGRTWPRVSSAGVNAWRLLFSTCICHPTVMMRRVVLDELGGYDPSALHAEDYELWSRAVFATRIENLPHVVLRRRLWDGTIGNRHADVQEQTVVTAMASAHGRLLGRPVDRGVVAVLRELHRSRAADVDLRGHATAGVGRHLADLAIAFRERVSRPKPTPARSLATWLPRSTRSRARAIRPSGWPTSPRHSAGIPSPRCVARCGPSVGSHW